MIFVTPQKITLELDNIANYISYILSLLLSKNDIENNKGGFLSDDDLSSSTYQNKRKKLIQLCELVANNIVEILEISSISPIKKKIK